MSSTKGRRLRRSILAAGLTGAVCVGVLAGATPADARAARPAIQLERAQSTVTAYLYEGTAVMNLAVWAVAGDEPFRVDVHRRSYDKRLTGSLVRTGPDLKLPAGTIAEDFAGLKAFSHVRITDPAGKKVYDKDQPFCPNSYDGQVRRRPDAPASSPYPSGCGGNPYSLGAVWGLQAGYATPVVSSYQEYSGLKAGVTYTAKVWITEKYRKLLKVSAAQTTATVTVKVVRPPDEEGRPITPNGASPKVIAPPSGDRPSGRKLAAASGPLPDLRSLPAWGIRVSRGRYLNFSATVWNAGPSRLVVDGFRQDKNEDLMDAYQYFFDANGNQVGYIPVGTMEWDPRDGHEHWHFTDFATYRLVKKNKKLAVRSQKEAFCLANTDAVDYTLPGANWHPDNTDLHTACGGHDSIAVREVLEAGSGDTYVQSLPGQSFDLKGLKNGTYYIEVRANPVQKLFESSTSNNVSYRKVTISGKSGHRKVKVTKVGLIKE